MDQKLTKKSNFFERISQIIDYYGIKNVNSFAKEYLGYDSSEKINRLKKENAKPSFEILNDISNKFEYINVEWLLTGRGNMLKSEKAYTIEDTAEHVVNDVEVLYQHKSKAIERFWNEQEVPLYELDATAGLSTIFSNNQQQNIINFIKIPDLPRCDGAIYARGDSMYPLIKSGDIVIFKEVVDLSYLQLGEMYLVDYTLNNDDYLVVKYIQKSEVEEHIKLVSHNPHHYPLDIPVSSVRAVAVIKASVRLNAIK